MQTLHIKNLEKYHPGYKDRSLIWSKAYFSMLNSDLEFEMLCEIDKWRFIAFSMLELQLKKPVKLDEKYLFRKGFEFKTRSLKKTIDSLGDLIDVTEQLQITEETITDYIYFIKLKKKGIIKIGYSSFLEKRFKDLSRQTNDEVQVLKIVNGRISEENEIHKQFEYCSISPEWYNPDKKLLNYIEKLQGVDTANVTWNPHEPLQNVTQSRIEKSRIEKNIQGDNGFILPDFVPLKTWDEFVKMRQKIKKPLTDYAKKLAVEKLTRFKDKGLSVTDILNDAIFGEWQGLYEPKNKKPPETMQKSTHNERPMKRPVRKLHTPEAMKIKQEMIDNGKNRPQGWQQKNQKLQQRLNRLNDNINSKPLGDVLKEGK